MANYLHLSLSPKRPHLMNGECKHIVNNTLHVKFNRRLFLIQLLSLSAAIVELYAIHLRAVNSNSNIFYVLL
jgi:hypothetical protein